MTDVIREASRKKRDMWTRCQKSPGDEGLRQQYMLLKAESGRCADKAQEEWWEAKAAEAERLHESAVRLGRGGSLLKDLRLLQRSQKLKSDVTLCAQDGTQLSSTSDKLECWREHFEQVSNISTHLVPSITSEVLEFAVDPQSTPECDDSLSSVPTEDEIGAAIRSLKNGKAPGGDEITAELLKLGGGEVVQSGSPSYLCVGVRDCARGLAETADSPPPQERSAITIEGLPCSVSQGKCFAGLSRRDWLREMRSC